MGDLHPFAIDSYIYNKHTKFNTVTNIAIEEAERIYEAGNLGGIINCIKLSEEDYEDFVLDNRSNFIEVFDQPPAFSGCALGMMVRGLVNDSPTNQIWNYKEEDQSCSYGCYINPRKHKKLETNPETVGFTLTHEFGHAMTSRGRLLLGAVPKWENGSMLWDEPPNLMSEGFENSNGAIEPDYTIIPIVKYFILTYLLCPDCIVPG